MLYLQFSSSIKKGVDLMKRRVFLRASLLLVLILLISGGKEIFALDQLNTYLPVVVDQSSLSPPIISPSPSNTTTPKPPITTAIEIRVIDSSADAEENKSGNMDLTSKDLELVYSGSNQTIGMNFNRIEIPQSATITNAYIQFKVDEASSEITALEIRAEATGDAELFSTLNRDISSRSMTTASVEWYPEPWQEIGEVGPNQRTPNISALIQEVINRSDWDEGNSIVLIVMGSGKRVAESYNGDPFGSPLLHIEYSSEPTPIPTHTTTITQTMTGSPTATATLTNTSTRTPIPQKSPTPSTTLTPTSSNTPTIINSPTAEPATSTFTPSNTPLVTNSPTPTPSPSEIPTSTITPSNTPIVTSSPTPSYPLHEFIEFSFVGPDSRGMGSPNPFLVEIETTFSGPGGKTYTVSGYYDGDGNGGMDGNLWKVKFNPEAPGVWTFGTNSQEPLLDGRTGIFSVFENSDCPAYQIGGMLDFSCVGRLEHIGDHYLKLHNGPYWLKGGEDDPEDFLAPGINAGFSSKYLAIDYLASKGVNSLYLLLNNIGGDGNNVWPWVGTTSSEAQSIKKGLILEN